METKIENSVFKIGKFYIILFIARFKKHYVDNTFEAFHIIFKDTKSFADYLRFYTPPLVMLTFRGYSVSVHFSFSLSDEANSKVHETLALAMDRNTEITREIFSIFKYTIYLLVFIL